MYIWGIKNNLFKILNIFWHLWYWWLSLTYDSDKIFKLANSWIQNRTQELLGGSHLRSTMWRVFKPLLHPHVVTEDLLGFCHSKIGRKRFHGKAQSKYPREARVSNRYTWCPTQQGICFPARPQAFMTLETNPSISVENSRNCVWKVTISWLLFISEIV